jgi:potassium-transporting ATPase KdpC subunit
LIARWLRCISPEALQQMNTELRPAIVSLALFSVLTGVVYPLVVTGVAGVAFHSQAHGSLITHAGHIAGSALIGQSFTSPQYLWGRPSAIAVPYDARGSSGSNLGPTNPLLDSLVRSRVSAIRAADPLAMGPVPVELVTSSASGLDPQLSPAAALYQIHRIAAARHFDTLTVRNIINANTESRTFGVLGEPRVNVLRVNLALDAYASPTQVPRP